jgi:hypothetical protein
MVCGAGEEGVEDVNEDEDEDDDDEEEDDADEKDEEQNAVENDDISSVTADVAFSIALIGVLQSIPLFSVRCFLLGYVRFSICMVCGVYVIRLFVVANVDGDVDKH